MPGGGREDRVPGRLLVIIGVDVDPAGCDQQSVGRDLAPRRPRLAAAVTRPPSTIRTATGLVELGPNGRESAPHPQCCRTALPIPSYPAFFTLTPSSVSVRTEFAADSPLEEDGFELVVPPRTKRLREGPGGSHLGLGPDLNWFRFSCRRPGWPASSRALCRSGTGGSNPVRSSGES
jgi:hypothetical protein